MAGYLGNVPVPQATQTRDRFVATASQTSFATSGYSAGYLDVYLNGVKLDSADFTATNGTDVVLSTGATAGDILDVVAFTTFTPAELATVASTGSYNDLSNQPTIPTVNDFGSSSIGLWTIALDGSNNLVFSYNGTAVVQLSTAGEVIALDDVTAFGTP